MMNEDTTNWEDIADIRFKQIKDLHDKLAEWRKRWLRNRNILPAEPPIDHEGIDKLFGEMVEAFDDMDELVIEEQPSESSDSTTTRLNRHLDKLETTTHLIPEDATPKNKSSTNSTGVFHESGDYIDSRECNGKKSRKRTILKVDIESNDDENIPGELDDNVDTITRDNHEHCFIFKPYTIKICNEPEFDVKVITPKNSILIEFSKPGSNVTSITMHINEATNNADEIDSFI